MKKTEEKTIKSAILKMIAEHKKKVYHYDKIISDYKKAISEMKHYKFKLNKLNYILTYFNNIDKHGGRPNTVIKTNPLCKKASDKKETKPDKTINNVLIIKKHGGARKGAGRKRSLDKVVKSKGKRGGARNGAGRKPKFLEINLIKDKLKIKKISSQKINSHKIKPKIPIVKWDKKIIPLLEKNNKPMSANEIIQYMFRGRHKHTKRVLRKRISVALSSLKRTGILKSFEGIGCIYYGLPSMTDRIRK